MGTPITGRETLIGLKKASGWRTAVACGANDGILILSETLKQTREHLDDDSAALPFIQRTDAGKITASGDITGYLRYDGLDAPIALAMGQAGTPTQQDIPSDWVATTEYSLNDLCSPTTPNTYRYKATVAGTSAASEPTWPTTVGETVVDGGVTWTCEKPPCYANSYKLTTDLAGLFATIAILKKSDIVHEFPSSKINGFSISGEMGAPLQITVNNLANLLDLASTTNTAATMANITYPDKGNRIILNKACTFMINDESGAALAAGDKVYPASFEFSFNRPMEGGLVFGNDDIDEPAGTGFPEITLTLGFPQYNDANHQFFTDWDAYTRKKAELYFKGALIEGTSYYELKMTFPNLKVADPDAAVSGPGKIPASIPFKVLGTDTAPTGMTGITQPFQIDVQNSRSTDPLA